MDQPKKLYLVWKDGEDEQYYNQYFSLEDAVSEEGDGVEVLQAKLTPIGAYKRSVRIVKTKKSKQVNNKTA